MRERAAEAATSGPACARAVAAAHGTRHAAVARRRRGRWPMRLLLQRVTRAPASASTGRSWAPSGRGLVVLVGVGHDDTEAVARTHGGQDRSTCASSATTTGAPTVSLMDVGGEVLAISQFTLFADTRKGRRPSFLDAAPPELGDALYEVVRGRGRGARACAWRAACSAPRWQVELVNDGPMTIWLDSGAGGG